MSISWNDFSEQFFEGPEGRIFYRQAGSGAPLLLIHGYPQSHLMWHKVAPALAEHYAVIIPDLRGYGQSFSPITLPNHSQMSFKAMAMDMAALMSHLGHEQFLLAGHDRGARVSHRLCLDYPERVKRVVILDILPTLYIYETLTQRTAMGYYHWLFLPQPAPLPETLIGGNEETWVRSCLGKWSLGDNPEQDDLAHIFPEEVKQTYIRHMQRPEVLHATTEDYRAGATIDLAHDRASRSAGQKLHCPALTLWGGKGLYGQDDVVGVWQHHSNASVTGHAMASGHFIAEEAPEATIEEMLTFLDT